MLTALRDTLGGIDNNRYRSEHVVSIVTASLTTEALESSKHEPKAWTFFVPAPERLLPQRLEGVMQREFARVPI